MRDGKTCQVCKKTFSNGNALRGHMMSHTQNISAPNAELASGSTLPSLETSNMIGANFKPHETVLMRSDHTSQVGEPGLKREEGAQQIHGKREMILDEEDSIGSNTSLTAVDEAALVLVAMSKGQRPENFQNWSAIDRLLATPKGKEEYYATYLDYDDDKSVGEILTQNMVSLTENNDEDVDSDADETYLVAREKKCKKTFICDVCEKDLGSYQALGGHRSNGKCNRLKICDKNDEDRELVQKKNDQDRCYECGVCGGAFESGQALGGHMRTHFM